MKITALLYCLLLLPLAQSCSPMKKPLVIGHRGAMGHETENTLASIQKALDLGVDMIEIDVFKIKGGEIVVFHDDTVDRLTNGGGNIEDYNIYDLKKLTLDGGHKIPMLQDVLKLIDKKTALNIELKGAGTVDRVNFIMEYYIKEKGWQLDDFLISSFRWDELQAMRDKNPNVPIAVLTGKDALEGLATAKQLQAVAINPEFSGLDQGVVDQLHAAELKVFPYTVNEPSDIERMEELQVDGIITNYPERVN